MHTKKVILVRIILRQGSFIRFLKKLKEKQKYEKAGQDIHIVRISTIFIFLVFPDFIRKFVAIVETKTEAFIKNID